MVQRKGLKVTDSERKVRVGIAAETYDDLKRKTIDKFKLSEKEIQFQTRDGIFIECNEDLAKIPPQTLLIWVRRGEKADTDAEILYKTIREVNLDFLTTGEKVHEFFTEQMKSKVYKLADILKELDQDQSKSNTPDSDPNWFKGIDSRAKTKEEYMFRRAQDRIRTYYYKTKDELAKNKDIPQDRLHTLLQEMQAQLKTVDFFGCYFDRRFCIGDALKQKQLQKSLCDETGTFKCQGVWNQELCLYNSHTINPYRSREDRIIFQTWNLDHRIERTRMIIPAISRALLEQQSSSTNKKTKNKKVTIDVAQIFQDIFTLNNLKLVHIICHDKGAHKTIDLDRYIKYI